MLADAASRQALDRARSVGLKAAECGADNTEQFDAQFREKALAFIVAHISKHGPVSGESTTLAAVLAGIRPRDDRHFGSVYQKALRDKRIYVVGEVARLRGHGSAGGRLYAAVRVPADSIPG
jgi:hypothetical protein